MKTYTSKDGTRRIFYDTHERLWTQLTLDAEGNQVGNVEYTGERWIAKAWLDGKSFSQIKLLSCERRAKLTAMEATTATETR